ncbi:hypothetical protein AX15_001090 [Amanita polypyramis BW_CC]|nr:hypothetical protein AX15_001090 [Amanita polypyramis BW_CC]
MQVRPPYSLAPIYNRLNLSYVRTAALSAFITGLYGITAGNPNYSVLAGAAALNSGITAVTFFGLREYAVSPVLVYTLPWPQYARRRRELLGPAEAGTDIISTEPPSLADRRKHKLLDSGLSGAAAGGILRGWKSGPAAALPGSMAAATVCLVLQYAFNEAGIARLKYVSRYQASVSQSLPTEPSSLSSDQNISLTEPSPSLMERVVHAIGVRRMTDEEYLQRMKKTREHHLQRIAELEKQLEAERRDNSTNGH